VFRTLTTTFTRWPTQAGTGAATTEADRAAGVRTVATADGDSQNVDETMASNPATVAVKVTFPTAVALNVHVKLVAAPHAR
jgi:hypothetical protein